MGNQTGVESQLSGTWFNFQYRVSTNEWELEHNWVPMGEPILHPVRMYMSLKQFQKARGRMHREGLKVEWYKLESPRYSQESVDRINNFARVFGGPQTRALPDATTDRGFGDMTFDLYVYERALGIISVLSSTGRNISANEIGMYGFTEEGFRNITCSLRLPPFHESE